MKKLFLSIATAVALLGVLALPMSTTRAQTLSACDIDPSSAICSDENNSQRNSYQGLVPNIINTLLWVLGVVSVIVIIAGGLRMTISSGNAEAVNGARRAITYAVVGLIVAMLGLAIVNFILRNIS